jgi:hypothetical protein
MKYLDLAIANEQIKTTDIKGREYAEVNQRIKVFRMLYPEGRILTEMLSNENGVCIFRALVSDGKGNTLATGTAYEKEDSSFINKTSYIENCETSAVGRALGMLGIGIDTSVASAEEVQNAINNQTLTQEEADNYTLTFGKYKGMTLKEVEEQDHKYINWIMDNTKDERILKMIEMSLGYAIPNEEEQQEIFELLDKVNNLIIEKDIDLEAIKKKFKVESTADIDTKTLKELVVYLEGK